MKKFISILFVVVCSLVCLSGCGGLDVRTHKSYTFSVETGDKVKVELDTTDGYDITSNVPFEISKDGEVFSQGIFIKGEMYNQYVSTVNTGSKAKVIDSGTKDSNQYIFWSYDDSEYNVAISIGDSNTGIILGNNVSEESAKECFDRLTITVE